MLVPPVRPIRLYSYEAPRVNERRLVRNDSGDFFHSGREGRAGLRPALIIGVDKRYVCEPNESENVAQVRHLEIQGFCSRTLLLGAPPSGDDDDLFLLQKPTQTIWSVTECLPNPDNLVDPGLQ